MTTRGIYRKTLSVLSLNYSTQISISPGDIIELKWRVEFDYLNREDVTMSTIANDAGDTLTVQNGNVQEELKSGGLTEDNNPYGKTITSTIIANNTFVSISSLFSYLGCKHKDPINCMYRTYIESIKISSK